MREPSATEPLTTPALDSASYERVAPELQRFAASLVGGDDAADIVSIVMIRALRTPKWPSVTNPRAYLYRAVFNEASRWRRRSELRGRHERQLALPASFDAAEFRPEIRVAVDSLSVRQRAVVVLTYWADLEPAAIAVVLQISEGSVRRHLARARARLRKVLDV